MFDNYHVEKNNRTKIYWKDHHGRIIKKIKNKKNFKCWLRKRKYCLLSVLNLNHNIHNITSVIKVCKMGTNEDPEVTVLFNGYSKDEGETMLANCTCTLIKGPPNVIVDTMTAWDGDKLQEALRNIGITCDEIDFVICTHGHSDHIGCNYLFPKAMHIVGFCVSHQNKYFNHDFSAEEYVINDKVKVIATPGHTLQDVSVIVSSGKGIVAVTGDLFENEEDLDDDSIWKSVGSDSEELQIINRKKILEMADYIVPGHGPMFRVHK